MSGTRSISKKIRARCPHCNNALDLSDMGTELFRRMIDELDKHGRVEAEGFGTFRIANMPAHKVANFGRDEIVVPARKVIRFKASIHAKEKINRSRGENDKENNNR